MPREAFGHVVITGASAGAGRAVAVAFARHGARVTLIARGRGGLDGVRAEVERCGGRACCIVADVADAAAVEAGADIAEARHGPIDVWVNSAMATVFAPLSALTPEEIRRVTEVTYLGQVHGTMAALRRMRRAGRGTIVNVGSGLAYHGLPLQSAYCAAKAAVRGFTESLHSELIHEGSRVRLSFVVLPALDTPQFDWARSVLHRRPRPSCALPARRLGSSSLRLPRCRSSLAARSPRAGSTASWPTWAGPASWPGRRPCPARAISSRRWTTQPTTASGAGSATRRGPVR